MKEPTRKNGELSPGTRTPTKPQAHEHKNGSKFVDNKREFGDEVTSVPALIQALIDAYGSSVAILDEGQTIRYVNRAWRQFASSLGVSGADALGEKYPLSSRMSKRDQAAIEAGIANVAQKNEVDFRTEYRCTALLEPKWFRICAALLSITDLDGDPMILVSHEDITGEKTAIELLQKERQRLDRLLDSTRILPWEADAESGEITYVGDRAEQLFGYPLKQWYEHDFKINHVHPDDRRRTIAEWARGSQSGDTFQCEYRMVTKDGRDIWISDIVSVRIENIGPATMSGFMIDITERKRAESRLMLLSGRLITAQEDERKRIARELHDDLNQRMALLSIELAQVRQILPNEPNRAIERVKELQRKTIEISEDLHRISYRLHPSKLDHLGLIPALRSFCSELAEHSGYRINFLALGSPRTLPADITLCIFRVAQEALQNSVKYSGALSIDITLGISESSVKLYVSDSGRGFDMKSGKMSGGLGFTSMAERLHLVGGFIEVWSEPLSGTQIEATVPLEAGSQESSRISRTFEHKEIS
jgi:PAS domain S-box-containing protein